MELVSMFAAALLLFIIIAVCAGCSFAFRKIKQNGFKSIKNLIMVPAIFLLILLLTVGVCYNISHKHWIKTTIELKESFPEINKIEFDKPTPTLYVEFHVDSTVDFNKAEEIFLNFLNKLDEDLLNEIIKNADIHTPADICVYFVSDTKSNNDIIDFTSNSDYTDWICTYPTDGNPLHGKEYQANLLQ